MACWGGCKRWPGLVACWHGLGRGRGYTPSRLLPLSPLLSLSQPHTRIRQDPKTGLKGTFWGKELTFCFVLVERAVAIESHCSTARNTFCWRTPSSSETEGGGRGMEEICLYINYIYICVGLAAAPARKPWLSGALVRGTRAPRLMISTPAGSHCLLPPHFP